MLAVADLLLLASAGAAFVAFRRLRPAAVPDVAGAFGVLERLIQKYVTGLPAGYTWSEAFDRIKQTGVEADWGRMREKLLQYEAYRYGGRDVPVEGKDEVLSLALTLRRTNIGRRPKR